MRKQIAYGVFSHQTLPDLVTDDKQLHVGPGVIATKLDDYWEGLGNTVAWLEEACPGHTFTLVLDELAAFDNSCYWSCNKMIRKKLEEDA